MFNLDKLKKEKGTNAWFSQTEDGTELFLYGTDEAPSIAALEDAKMIISEYFFNKEKIDCTTGVFYERQWRMVSQLDSCWSISIRERR